MENMCRPLVYLMSDEHVLQTVGLTGKIRRAYPEGHVELTGRPVEVTGAAVCGTQRADLGGYRKSSQTI